MISAPLTLMATLTMLTLGTASAAQESDLVGLLTCDQKAPAMQDPMALRDLVQKVGKNNGRGSIRFEGPLRAGGLCLRNIEISMTYGSVFSTGELCDGSLPILIQQLTGRWGGDGIVSSHESERTGTRAYFRTSRAMFHVFSGKPGDPVNPVRRIDRNSETNSFWCMAAVPVEPLK